VSDITVTLTPQELLSNSLTMARGQIPVILSLSAYDVPSSFTVRPHGDRVQITFNYVDHEESVDHVVDQDLTVRLGRNSGKVLAFLVKPKHEPQEIIVRIVEGVDQQIQRATRPNQRLNYELIKRLVSNRLEPALVAP
jgi:hypothetical protein